ncbi:cell division protein FtsL [Aerococcus agrisoli]|uniref:Cell division protein FtsL n=1 Tax=Aerococcus agrisoli TaxID=2487350 RepID=A0A3N4GDH4_9LACT|nr:cell division protein FtsL [Aerococcus agrisoli]RPA60832.1 cell division protein FtsL [Aerococcus agrisoli]
MAIFILKDRLNMEKHAMPAEKAIPNIPAYPKEQTQKANVAMAAIPASVPHTTTKTKTKVKVDRSISIPQKMAILGVFALMIAAVLGLVIMRANVSATSQQLQDKQAEVQELQIEKENLTQEVHELSTYSRIMEIAGEQGLTMDEENIRNVE